MTFFLANLASLGANWLMALLWRSLCWSLPEQSLVRTAAGEREVAKATTKKKESGKSNVYGYKILGWWDKYENTGKSCS